MKKTMVLLLLASVSASVGSLPASAAQKKIASRQKSAETVRNCRIFLKMAKAEQRKVARSSGHSLADAIWGCEGVIRISKGGHARNRGGDSAEPAWYGDSCVATRFCPANFNCIRGMCKPLGYGGCDSGTYSCSIGESCVSGVCR